MASRIDIELTSARPDGTWTWRAAGALKPRGILDGKLLYEGAKSGDVVRAEADFEIDGISVVGVVPPKAKSKKDPQLLPLIEPSRERQGRVTTQLARPGGRRSEHPGRREPAMGREPPVGRERTTRNGSSRAARLREGTPPDLSSPDLSSPDLSSPDLSSPDLSSDEQRAAGKQPAPWREGAGTRPPGKRARPGTDTRARRNLASGGERPQAASPGAASGPSGRQDARRGREPTRGQGAPGFSPTSASGSGRASGSGGASASGRVKDRRLNPGHAHREAVLASLRPEEQPVAEQVLRGGIPAVRTAIHLEREKAAAEGRPAPNAESLLAMAEALLPRLKAAEWHDRAEAASKNADAISLRDLRSVVAGSDLARDQETRELARIVREAFERRLANLREQWAGDVARHLDAGRVVRALAVSARPPEPSTRLPDEVANRLADAAGAAMAPETTTERWVALIEAASASPVRRSLKPVGFPPSPGPDLLRAAHQHAARVPALAGLLGLAIPPPPGPLHTGAIKGSAAPSVGSRSPGRTGPEHD